MTVTELCAENPTHVVIALPHDAAVLEHLPAGATVALSAVYSVNPRLRPLVEVARDRAAMVLVDPKTAYFQFEGHMSMPDYRALPYSPGRGALGTLWQPARFGRTAARAALIDEVFAVQRRMGADVLLSPYFYIPHAEHPWLQACRDFAADAVRAAGADAVGVPVCVDIDALIRPEHLETIANAYRDIDAALFLLTVVNFDERRADPTDVRALVQFVRSLKAGGRPVVLSHVGRAGLLAIAEGAAGYAAGTHGLESHPRSFFREMMGTRRANAYYLHECYIHLPVSTAQACLESGSAQAHPACGCSACDHETVVTRLVSRRLAQHCMLRRFIELESLRSVPPADRRGYLVESFSAALTRTRALAEAIASVNAPPIRDGDFHYLEVLREAAGGPPATLPLEDDD